MEFLPLISIPAIYFLIAFIKPELQPKLPFNLCAICAAVSLTWLGLIALWLAGYSVPILTIGILMGMSVTGIMYKAEGLFKKQNVKNFWFVRLVIIIGGLYGIGILLQKEWSTFTVITIGSLLTIAIASLLFQGITHKDALGEVKKKNAIVKRLENCC